MRQILQKVPRVPADCSVFKFSTSRLVGSLPASACRFTHWRLRRALRRRKIAILGELDCPGQVKGEFLGWFGLYRGHPSEAGIQSASQFAQQIAARAKEVGS
jgi:hypothetical protein